jgi:hypothetical protein
MNERLAAHNTKLSLGFLLVRRPEGQSMEDGLIIATEKIERKKRVGPAAAIASFCPFCGESYEEVRDDNGS